MIDAIIKYWKSDLSNMNLIIKKFTKKQQLEFWSFFLVLLILIVSLINILSMIIYNNWKILTFLFIASIILIRIIFWLVDRNSKFMNNAIKSNYGHLSLTKYTLSELKSTLIIKKCEELQVENYKEVLDALRYREQRWILIIFGSSIASLSLLSDIISNYFDEIIKKFENEIPIAFVIFTFFKVLYVVLVLVIFVLIYHYYNNSLIQLQIEIENYLIKKKN